MKTFAPGCMNWIGRINFFTDLPTAIALSLQEADKGQPKTSALYPTSSYPPVHESRPREIRKVLLHKQ